MLKTDDVIKVLDDLVETAGGTAFMDSGSGCWYRDEDGAPLCIVGHVLARLKPEAFRIIPISEGGVNSTIFPEAMRVLGIEAEQDAFTLLMWAQMAQDDRQSWASAVDTAKKKLARNKEEAGH